MWEEEEERVQRLGSFQPELDGGGGGGGGPFTEI